MGKFSWVFHMSGQLRGGEFRPMIGHEKQGFGCTSRKNNHQNNARRIPGGCGESHVRAITDEVVFRRAAVPDRLNQGLLIDLPCQRSDAIPRELMGQLPAFHLKPLPQKVVAQDQLDLGFNFSFIFEAVD